MIALAATFVTLLAVASAQNQNVEDPDVSYYPTESWVSEHYSSPYYYKTFYSHHKKYVYTYETCSSPPSSIEVCLSSIFTSIEDELASIEATLKSAGATIEADMHNEHAGVTNEISWVSMVNSVAYEVISAINFDGERVCDEISELYTQRQDVIDIYYELEYQLMDIIDRASFIVEQRSEIFEEYQKIQGAKWSLYMAISYIESEKIVIQGEQAEIEGVVGKLYSEIYDIEQKISQLNKRQNWLLDQEEKLSVNMHNFQQNINVFRRVESDLVEHEDELYEQQIRLKQEAYNVIQALDYVIDEYANIFTYIQSLEWYEGQLYDLLSSVTFEAEVFISAYEEFTCEDSLLYYEACKSNSASSAAVLAKPAAP